MSYTSRNNTSTLPQGFSIYQPNLGAQLQFLPAIGTPELDELINAYVAGPSTTQEKRASVSLDFLEYAHVTGQTFKFYPVYSTNAAVESPVTDSGYGSSFNVSPVTSNWDFSQISTSRSPPSQQARTSPKAASSRQHASDFSNLPGMKIMTRDGLDVTNSASRGSKTKEQRDHAHLMRIIKACDSCKRKKIRCDPSHKKRVSSQSQPQPAAKSTKKSKAVVEAVRVAAAPPPPVQAPVQAPDMALDQTFTPIDLENFNPSLSALEPWDEFIQYPPADVNDEYDFFNDPAGYFSPESASSSSVSAYSTKPVTPTSQQELSAPYDLPGGTIAASPQLPFNQTESTSNYVDFNLFSPDSSFSEDEQMVPIELSRHLNNHSYSPQSNTLRSDQSSGGSDVGGGLINSVSGVGSWSVLSSRQSGEDNSVTLGAYRDPGASDGGQDCSPWSSSVSSDDFSHPSSLSSIESTARPLASSSVGCADQSDSVAVDMDQSSIRRGTDTTTTVIHGDSSAGPSGEGRKSENAQTASRVVMTLASESIHRLKSTLSPVSPGQQPPSEDAIVAPRTEISSQQDVFEHDVAVIANATTTTPTTTTTTTTTGDDSERYAQLNAVDAPSAPLQPQDYYAPCVAVTGSEESLSPLMISAGLTLASGTAKSSIGQYFATTISVMLALAAIGSLFLQSRQKFYHTAIKASRGRKSHATGGAKQTFQATPFGGCAQALWDRVRLSQSQLASGTTSVSRMISRSTSLVAV